MIPHLPHRLVLLALTLAIGVWPPASHALETGTVVSVTLTNGVQYEGTVLAETADEVQVETSQAGGTIIQTRTFARGELTAITPLGEAELHQRAMAAAYDRTRRCQLNATTSYPLADYDRVIETILQPFVERYPDSPHVAAVTAQLAAWQAERQRVAKGEARYQGTWMGADEAALMSAEAERMRRLKQGEALLAQKRFEQALEAIRSLTIPEAQELRIRIYQHWVQALEAERQSLDSQVAAAQGRVTQAKAAFTTAKQAAQRASSLRETRPDGRLGSSQKPMADLIRAKDRSQAAAADLAHLQTRLANIKATLAMRSNQARALGVPATSAARDAGATSLVAKAATPKTEDFASPGVLTDTASFASKYWPLGLLALLIVLLVIGRVFGR